MWLSQFQNSLHSMQFQLVFYPKAKVYPTKCPNTWDLRSPLLYYGSGWSLQGKLSIVPWCPQVINRLIFTVSPLYRLQTRIMVNALACGISNFYRKWRRACWDRFEDLESENVIRFYDVYLLGICGRQPGLTIWVNHSLLRRLSI